MACRVEDVGVEVGAVVELREGAATEAGRMVLDSWTFVRAGLDVVGIDSTGIVEEEEEEETATVGACTRSAVCWETTVS